MILANGECVGQRTSLASRKPEMVRTVNLEWDILLSRGAFIFVIKGGVTGYESFYIYMYPHLFNSDWCACAGTEGRWDQLVIPRSEMARIKQELVDKGQWFTAIGKPVEVKKEI